MPPPPPPSKSYLIQIDTDSSDDDSSIERDLEQRMSSALIREEEHNNNDRNEEDSAITAKYCIQKKDKNYFSHSEESHEEERGASEPEVAIADSQSPNKEKKKKRRRKRHRKKKQANTSVEEKNVSFGSVSIRMLERELGGDGVPSDGGWPLGFSETVIEDIEPIDIGEYEDHRRVELEKRWKEKVQSPLPVVLETRQWDYKKPRDEQGFSIRNPLFAPLSEDERHALLINQSISSLHPTKSQSSSCSGNSHGNRNQQSRRHRSNSVDFAAGPYDPVHVRHVRNELEDLRGSRTSNGSTGCTCRKLHVHLPPKHGGGGKKSQHKRLSMSKVKEELRKRHCKLPSHTVSRDELEQTLFDMVQDEGCCSSNDCPCVRNGLGCQADACSCWSHTQNDTEVLTTVESFQAVCGNRYGIYVVDSGAIASYRKSIITKMTQLKTCRFISPNCDSN